MEIGNFLIEPSAPPGPVELAHEAYINHLMRCRGCYAPTQLYCSVGLALKVEYDAQYLTSIQDAYTRRWWLLHEHQVNPGRAVVLKTRVLELHAIAIEKAKQVVKI